MSAGADVLYFQDARPGRTVSQAQLQLEVRGDEARLIDPADPLQKVSREVERMILDALDHAHLTQADAARFMRISESLFSRQLQNRDNQHLSFQRSFLLPDVFWRELMITLCERRGIGTVERSIKGL